MTTQSEKVRDLLRQFSTAMLVTHDGTAGLRARPMAIAEVTDSGLLWFMSEKASEKADEIRDEHRVQVICQQERIFLSLSGMAKLETDRATIERLWKPAYIVWFPKGESDPNLVLIGVTPEIAEYWDISGLNSVKYLFESIRALVTGTTPNVQIGEQHGNVPMTPAARI